MSKYLITYATVITVLMVLDALWLGVIAKSLYQAKIGHLMTETPNFYAAILFYLIYAAGLIAFVVAPYSALQNWKIIIGYAALYGLCTYSTYALTNLAILKTWPIELSMIDVSWGIFITIFSASVGKLSFNFIALN